MPEGRARPSIRIVRAGLTAFAAGLHAFVACIAVVAVCGAVSVGAGFAGRTMIVTVGLFVLGVSLLTFVALDLRGEPGRRRSGLRLTAGALNLLPLALALAGGFLWSWGPVELTLAVVFGLASLAALFCADVPRYPPGHCWKCGYDLHGNTTGLCPECSTAALRSAELGAEPPPASG